MAKKKMAWSKANIDVARTAANDAMAADSDLQSVGIVKDKSATLEAEDGETMEAYGTGHELVAMEESEGNYVLNYRVIEPDDDFYSKFDLGEVSGESDFNVKTHVVEGDYSVRVTPKNVGAIGIKAPVTHVKLKPGWSEEEGNYCDVTHTILKGSGDYWYARFKKPAPAQSA